uniref:Uncharacterized protein n=1 Tax=Ascaris lumbricoides TaxID=6252 RepID=A0A0M3I8K6_ASCLU
MSEIDGFALHSRLSLRCIWHIMTSDGFNDGSMPAGGCNNGRGIVVIFGHCGIRRCRSKLVVIF